VRKLESMLGRSREVMRIAFDKAQKRLKRIVYPEGEQEKILRACQSVVDQGIAKPILLGREDVIREKIKDLKLNIEGVEIIDPSASKLQEEFAEILYEMRKRKGVTPLKARRMLRDPLTFGLMLVHHEDYADGLVGGINSSYPDMMRPALRIIGLKKGIHRVTGLMMLLLRDRTIFFADTTVNTRMDAETLAEIAMLTAVTARTFNIEPRIAMLSYSNFGELRGTGTPEMVAAAVEIVRERRPELVIDGEMMADAALDPEICKEQFPHSVIQGNANVLIFPDMASGNIAYKLMQKIGKADAIGPILMGMKKPVNILNYYSTVTDIVNLTAITAVSCEV
jgi:malate dehydrogenase (oxaloacetate-decarboxylating)(NADP+)